MAGEKRKGKEKAIPKRKKTRAEKEAERAAMVARAAIESATGPQHPVRIREPGSGNDDQQDEPPQSPVRRTLRPRTRGGHTESQRQTQGEPRTRTSRRSARDRVEDEEAAAAVSQMDNAVRVQEGVQLLNLTKARAPKVKKLRWAVLLEEWQSMPRHPGIDRRFWTPLQASFYESYRRVGHRLFPHRLLDWNRVEAAGRGADIMSHFAHFRGLGELVQFDPDRRLNAYVEDWVRVFYNTVWINRDRTSIWFMFAGEPYLLTRAQIAEHLGVDLGETSIHSIVYGDADPPRRALVGGTYPSHEEVSVMFRQPFPATYPRTPDVLTDEAYAIHMALRRTLLPRSGYTEGFTGLQQRLVLHILTHQEFDIVDVIIAEIEEVITDGVSVRRQFPYAHWISYILSRLVPEGSAAAAPYHADDVRRFPSYKPTVPEDPRRGRHVLRAAMEKLHPEVRARVTEEDEALLDAESRLPEDEEDWSLSESESSDEEPPVFDDGSGAGTSAIPSPLPTVSEAQVTQPAELTSLIQQMMEQQRADRLAAEARAEQLSRETAARFAQQQQEAARAQAATEERFAGLIDSITQRQDAQLQQMQRTQDAQIQQMQQTLVGMFGMMQQFLAQQQPPQQPGVSGTSAPAIALTPAPAPVTTPAGISMTALLGSAGRPVFSPLPSVSLFQTPDGPTVPASSTSILPSGGVDPQPQPAVLAPQPQSAQTSLPESAPQPQSDEQQSPHDPPPE